MLWQKNTPGWKCKQKEWKAVLTMARQATLANATKGGTLKLPGLKENVAVFFVVATNGPRGDPIGWPTQWLYFQSSPASKSTTLVDSFSVWFESSLAWRKKGGKKEGKGKGRMERRKGLYPLVDLECGPAQPSLFSLANWIVCFLIAVSQNTPRTRVGPGSVTEHWP